MATPHTETRLTLLVRLQNQESSDSAAAWQVFIDYYGPKINVWCRRWGLQQADSADVTQEVLLKLAICMRSFVYQPGSSFRAWLKTVTHHALSDFIDKRHRAGTASHEGV